MTETADVVVASSRGEITSTGGQSAMFSKVAQWAAQAAGRPITFGAAALLIVGWAIAGPFCGYSSDWQLVINTGTTIITFLMVFLIQNSQNRDTTAMQMKLDELIRATKGARSSLLDLESLPQEDLAKLQSGFHELARRRKAESGETHEPTQSVEN